MEKGSRERKQKSGGPVEDLFLIANLPAVKRYDYRFAGCGEGRIL